jgi:hypothetical protein
MNAPKTDALDYIQFLLAAQKAYTCTEAARCQPETDDAPAHDSFTRFFLRQPPDTEALWEEAQPLVQRESGLLVNDDTTLDKAYARKIELVTHHWSGKHHRVVQGINLTTLLWTDGKALIPTDFRVLDKSDGWTKHDHFRVMLHQACQRGFSPRYVVFDSWYSSLENLKALRDLHWRWLTRLKSNRRVDPGFQGNRPIRDLEIPPEGRGVHLKGYGMIRVFRVVAQDGDTEYWATDDLSMDEPTRKSLGDQAWGIEVYHRGIKQCCGIERCECRSAQAQRVHILCSLRAFLRLEAHRLATSVSWYDAKTHIIRDAIRAYLAQPKYLLVPTA